MEARELGRALSRFLAGLGPLERDIFLCRYWYLAGTEEVCRRTGFSPGRVRVTLHRTRVKLRNYLKEEELL